MAKFNRIKQSDPNFQNAVTAFESLADRFDFEALAAEYNELAPQEMVSFEYKKGKSSQVRAQLARRGLTPGVDFDVRSANIANNEEVALVTVMRLSAKAPVKPTPIPRKKKDANASASTNASSSGAPAADSKPVDAKGNAKK